MHSRFRHVRSWTLALVLAALFVAGAVLAMSGGTRANAARFCSTLISTVTVTVGTTTTPPLYGVLWQGAAENGFTDWQELQAARLGGPDYTVSNVGDGDIQIVSSPTHGPSTAAYKHIIYTQLANDGTIRADLAASVANTGAVEGAEAYYHFAVYLPGPSQTWAAQYNWNTLGDTHPANNNNPYAAEFGIRDIDPDHVIYFQHHDVSGGLGENLDWTPIAPLVYDQWIDVVFYVHWSTSSSTGHVSVWSNVNGAGYQLRFDRAYRTFAAGDPPYWKEALYTGGSRSWTNTAVFDGACRASTFDAAVGC